MNKITIDEINDLHKMDKVIEGKLNDLQEQRRKIDKRINVVCEDMQKDLLKNEKNKLLECEVCFNKGLIVGFFEIKKEVDFGCQFILEVICDLSGKEPTFKKH